MTNPDRPLALLSVSNKTGLQEFARALSERHGYHLVSTGGTARILQSSGLRVEEISSLTGFPEIMDGRVKTLHPKVHGGLLCRRDDPIHRNEAVQNQIPMIDLLVVNLYPFRETVARPDCTDEDAVENIDIGGPAMLRSAAKNHASVLVVCDPSDYARVLEALDLGDAAGLANLRRELAAKVFRHTAGYDAAIASYLENHSLNEEPDLDAMSGFPRCYTLELPRSQVLRYGENPHQKAALYGDFGRYFEQLQGKELSYNNILDVSSAAFLIGEFQRPTVAILKHTNPCGVASADSLDEAWENAYATDRQAPFGGIIIINRTMEESLARNMAGLFTEVIIAPGFSPAAMAVLSAKKNLRLLTTREGLGPESLQEIRSVAGGILVQDRDRAPVDPREFKVVTRREPTTEEWQSLLFGWKVVRHVKSNAIVYTREERTLGIGAGQMARVDSSRIAVWKAGESGLDLTGSAIASEALFPFADGLLAAANAGATAAIQPGGSIRDDEVISAANEANMAMVFTGRRHFRH